MGLKARLQMLQQTGKAVANYADDVARLMAQSGDDVARAVATKADDAVGIFCRKPVVVNPAELKGLRFAPIKNSEPLPIPEYLYHLTDKKHYELILKDGKILMSRDELNGIPKCPGVFMIDIKNFFQNWGENNRWFGSLKTKLVRHATQSDSNLVLLRIPTNSLDKSKIVLRDQETYMGDLDKLRAGLKEFNITADYPIPAEFKRKFTFYFDGLSPETIFQTDIDKKSLEYIYREAIPISKVEKVGEFDTLRDLLDNERSPMHFIFSGLLKGQREESLVSLLA